MSGGYPAWLNDVLRQGQSGELSAQWRARVDDDARDSAVLMLFGPNEAGGEDVVLTERAADMRNHPGQVSFPGGRVEPTDESRTQTALREANEEIGLNPEGVQVLGELKPIPLAVTNHLVNPVLAWWSQPSAISALQPQEVARVERVRVADLVNPNNRHTVVHPRGFEGPAFSAGGLFIWGFTAFVLDAVLTAGGRTQPWDVADRRPLPERFLTR